jgi:alcohol dehydrogenase class IV
LSELHFGEGAASHLPLLLAEYAGPVFVVTGQHSYHESGAADSIEPALRTRRWTRYQVEDRLPGSVSVEKGLAQMGSNVPSVIVGVGGGRVIDTAKVIALSIANPGLNLTTRSVSLADAVDLIAIPTTAGSGSERTPFAVYYVGAEKHSVAHPSLEPKYALVDPRLTYSMTPLQTASTGLDAICHAIESAWSVAASESSRALSFAALDGAWDVVLAAVRAPDPGLRRAMAEASTVAGSAIATAKTTASHALSYHLSAVHGVPHGPAAALTLGALLEFNAGVDAENAAPGVNPETVKAVINRVCDRVGARDALEARSVIEARLAELGIPNRLSRHGVSARRDVEDMAASVNRERLGNNPRILDRSQLCDLLEGLL